MTVDWVVRDAVFTAPGVMSPEECAELIGWAEGVGFDDAPVTTPFGMVRMPSIRNNARVMADSFHLAGLLWSRLSGRFSGDFGGWRPIGLNERFRIYRYDPGQYFRRHTDGSFRRNRHERSFWTLMVYLNEGFGGGETAFDDVVVPRTGMALGFLHDMHHEGRAVTEGRKYVLRTDVMYRFGPDGDG